MFWIVILFVGDGFATGIIDLGGDLLVSQISSFNKVWTTYEGGPDNLGATFFEPTNLSEGFYMLGCYCQPNNKPLHGWVLVAKDKLSSTTEALKKPIDYKLMCNINSTKNQDGTKGYIWLPIAPDGYKVLGHVVTTSSNKPSFDKIRCVRSNLTDECVKYKSMQLWSTNNKSFNVYDVRPMKRGIEAKGVYVGTFLAQSGVTNSKTLPIVCLKNTNDIDNLSSMPNFHQIETLINAYSPYMYLHPSEKYLPSSVNWFFTNGALLYEKRKGIIKENSIEPTGSNLPQGDSNDDNVTYWIDLPIDEAQRERIKKGDLQSSKAYIHVKPMLGGTFTDIVMWIFYPINGGAKAKVACTNIPLRTKGEHVGDWEHVTLRISNFNGELRKVYFSQHSKGQWVDACEVEFQHDNRFVAYSSLNGHALFPRPGLVMQGMRGFGIRNDAAKSDVVMDLAKGFEIVSAEYLGSEIIEPPWLNYNLIWGPKEGPKGPKQKDFWIGDER